MYVCLFLLLYMYIHQFCFMKLALYFIYMLRAKAARHTKSVLSGQCQPWQRRGMNKTVHMDLSLCTIPTLHFK